MIGRGLAIALMMLGFGMASGDDLAVLKSAEGEESPRKMTYTYLLDVARESLAAREAAYEKLKTPEDVAAYQEKVRAFFLSQLGPFPERAPLNARVVAAVEKEGYRLEKVIFESLPGVHVTALLRIPSRPGPHPAVVIPCGHSTNGKAAEAYQRGAILLAKNGIASLNFDPIGQGERFQILNEEGKRQHGTTIEHTFLGVGCTLLGKNTASYMIWDGMRAVDYLASRPDIDAGRIGCAGNSGGGTQTSYFMALDERICCAAPACYITSLARLYETIGPQDAEQNIHGQAAFAMDHADYVVMRAPRPTLICSATQDFFDIEGTWGSFRQAKRIYTRLGFSERVDLVETDEKHGWSIQIREGMVRWMRRWLLDVDEVVTEPEFPILTDEEAQCTPNGQVLLLDGARSVRDLNVAYEADLAKERRALWRGSREKALAKVRDLAGIRDLASLPPLDVRTAGVVRRNGVSIEKLEMYPEPGIVLPALLFSPGQESGEACLYLHGKGKHAEAGPGGAIEALLRKGYRVLAVDVRCTGETESDRRKGTLAKYFGSEWQETLLAYTLGRSMLGMRAEDILVCARYLSETSGKPVRMVATGELGPPALHAAALEPGLFGHVRLEGAIRSWAELIPMKETVNQLVNTVHGALGVYDLPDLIGCIPAEKLEMAGPVDGMGR